MRCRPSRSGFVPGKLDATSVDIWLVDVTDSGFLATADSDLASESDRLRASGMADPAAGRLLLARRSALRLILSRYVDAPPGELRIVTAPGGKPVLLPGPAFSVAHSGDLYAVAVTGAWSVGVDVEHRRDVSRASDIANRWFGKVEAERLAAFPETRLNEEFLRLWTAKEALAKRHGAGLRLMKGRGEGADGALDVDVALAEERLQSFDAGPEYLAAVASTETIMDINVTRASEELWTI